MRRLLLTASLVLAAVLNGGQAIAVGRVVDGLRVAFPAAADGQSSVALELSLPAQVAAVDGRLLFDASAAQLIGIAPLGGGEVLTPVAIDGGAAFGAYGLSSRGGRTTLRAIFEPLAAGELQVRVVVDSAADAAGRRLALGGAVALGGLRVANGTRQIDAPAAGRAPQPLRAGHLLRDLFADGVIGEADLATARAAWLAARESDVACDADADPDGDVNGDGCVDIADLQALTAALGRQVGPLRVSPDTTTANLAAAESNPPIIVTSAADSEDAVPSDGVCADAQGRCTLRAAIATANWRPGPDRIEFNLPGTAPVRIQMSDSLPRLMLINNGDLTIDGYSQPGARVNTATFGSNAIPGVELRGLGHPSQNVFDNGLFITSANNTIRGILFNRHYRSIYLDHENAHDNLIAGNFIGFTPSFGVDSFYMENGVRLNLGAHHNIIGTPALADRNVIANGRHGIDMYGPGTNANVIQNNVLCMTPSGAAAHCNTAIDHNFGPKNNIEGGLGQRERNYIGPTSKNGIEVSHGWDPDTEASTEKWQNNANQILGNWIGFRADGHYDPDFRSGFDDPNKNDANGVNVYDGSNNNLVEGNWIASVWDGINTMSPTSSGNVFRNNVIGESPHGEAAPLKRHGIHIRVNTRSVLVEGNIIKNAAGYGIGLTQKDVVWAKLTRNIISDMPGSQAIYLAPDPKNPGKGANNLFPAPVITSATTSQVKGTGVAGATVEVYRASRSAGNSGLPIEYLGSAVVGSDGRWTASVNAPAGGRVTALEFNPAGNTSELGINVNVGSGGDNPPPPPADGPLAKDDFGRNVSGGWGAADKGGTYSYKGKPPAFAVNNGVATMRLGKPGASRGALLDNAVGRDVDMLFKVAVDKLPTKGKDVVYGVTRRNGSSEYRAELILKSNGGVNVKATALIQGKAKKLAKAVTVSGLTQSAGAFIWLRVQVTGVSPTTIRVKAWRDGQSEPSGWAYTTTDNHAKLQRSGSVGLRAWLNKKVPKGAVVMSFDGLLVEPVK